MPYQPDYTKKPNDLYRAYEFILNHQLSEENVVKTHQLLSQNLLPESQRGRIRNNMMFILNEADRIEYIAAEPFKVRQAWIYLFDDINLLQTTTLDTIETFILLPCSI